MNEDTLVARIARLETIARRDRTVALGLLVVLLSTAQNAAPTGNRSFAVAGATGSATIEAGGLYVRDATKSVREHIGLGDSGVFLDSYDSSGVIREAMVVSTQGNPDFSQFGSNQKLRADIYLVSGTGDPAFAILDAAAKTRLALKLSDQEAALALYGSDGKPRAFFAAPSAGGPSLVMNDGTGTTRLTGGFNASGVLGLDVRDASGAASFSKP